MATMLSDYEIFKQIIKSAYNNVLLKKAAKDVQAAMIRGDLNPVTGHQFLMEIIEKMSD